MARAKNAEPQRLSREEKLKILKSAKVYKGSTKIPKGKATGAQKRALALFRDDIPMLASGKAKAVKVGKVKADDLPKGMTAKRGRVVVAVEDKNEVVRYNRKKKRFTSTVESHGTRYRRIILSKSQDPRDLPKNKNYRYIVPFRQWGLQDSPLFSDFDELERFMKTFYEEKGTYKNWREYVEVLELVSASDRDSEELQDD